MHFLWEIFMRLFSQGLWLDLWVFSSSTPSKVQGRWIRKRRRMLHFTRGNSTPRGIRVADGTRRKETWFRITLATYLMSISVVCMNLLNSRLTSTMAIKGDEDHISSFRDVLRFPNVQIASEKGTSTSQMFTVSRTRLCSTKTHAKEHLTRWYLKCSFEIRTLVTIYFGGFVQGC